MLTTPRFRFVAGKGGVGKTTLAAARALGLADAGHSVLVASTDPAHSLGDALLPDGSAPLSGAPRSVAVETAGRLLAAELAAPAAYERWLGERRSAFQTLAERGTYLAPGDVSRLLDLPMPGVDELVGLLELVRLARESACSHVVVDTAPTAHTLRLLQAPAALERVAQVLAALQARHREVAVALAGGYREDEADAVVADLEAEARALGELVRSPERAAFTWVLLPEALSVAETADAVKELRRLGATVDEVVVNRLTPPPPEACPPCERRRRAEAEAVREAEALAAGARVLLVAEAELEPRGAGALRALAAHLEPGASPEPEAGAWQTLVAAEPADPATGILDPERGEAGDLPAAPPAWLERLAPPGVRLLLFGGKGGVGKTTCAAAVAAVAARAAPGRPVLLLSTDPAHSIGDVLEVPLADEPRAVPGGPANLRARELDASAAFAARKERYREALATAFSGLARSGRSGLDAPLDRAVVERLLEATPPGLDELVAVAELTDALVESGGGDDSCGLVVLDTAPTGHALRLLEMPELALRWDHALLAILLEYRDVVGLPAELSRDLVELSRSLKRLRALLADPARCRFAAVTRGGELPRRETRRLVAALDELGVAVPAVIVNAVPAGRCHRCQSAAQATAAEMQALRGAREGDGGWTILAAPAEFPPPRGIGTLERWAHAWAESPGEAPR